MPYPFNDKLRVNAQMVTTEGAYKFEEQGPVKDQYGVDYFILKPGEEFTFPVNTWPVNIRNLSNSIIYYGPRQGGKDHNWPVLAGGKSGPISDPDNLYFWLPADATENAKIHYSFMGVITDGV